MATIVRERRPAGPMNRQILTVGYHGALNWHTFQEL